MLPEDTLLTENWDIQCLWKCLVFALELYSYGYKLQQEKLNKGQSSENDKSLQKIQLRATGFCYINTAYFRCI